MTKEFSLPQRLDSAEAKGLADSLLELRGEPIQISGDAVQACGTLCMQVLVATRKQWLADGHELSLTNPSESFLETCKYLGIALSDVGFEEVE